MQQNPSIDIESLDLNQRAHGLAASMIEQAQSLRVKVVRRECGATLIDCGADSQGGLAAGLRLAEVCLAGLGSVSLSAAQEPSEPWQMPVVMVRSDQPLAACLASQYAGWAVHKGSYFAMGSGPMRALAASEPIFQYLRCQENSSVAVGVLETKHLPTDEVLEYLASACSVKATDLTILTARTKSLAGMLQVTARTLETALHKLHALGFDLRRVVSGSGSAPMPPCAKDDITAIGRTNDAVLYGGVVHLWVRGDDDYIRQWGPQVPSRSSPEFGRPFLEIFEASGRDFYKIDPMLFSPARILFHNLDSGVTQDFGGCEWSILARSFQP